MTDRTPIEWADATWNPVGGCTRVTEGCRNCYAEIMAARFSGPGQWGEGLARIVRDANGKILDHRWTGQMRLNTSALDRPLRWKKPRRIFVNSTSDLFHESVPDEWIDQVFAIMAVCPQHTFQVLTKRPERARKFMSDPNCRRAAAGAACYMHASGEWSFPDDISLLWPLQNVWLGTSVEDQAAWNARWPHLARTPAAVRFVSAEPLLGPLDLIGSGELHWLIAGGESGRGARPMHPDWARSLRDQCQSSGVAFFFKQWGEWGPDVGIPPGRDPAKPGGDPIMEGKGPCAFLKDSTWQFATNGYAVDLSDSSGCGELVYRLGKKLNGRLLDGREWNEMPNPKGGA